MNFEYLIFELRAIGLKIIMLIQYQTIYWNYYKSEIVFDYKYKLLLIEWSPSSQWLY